MTEQQTVPETAPPAEEQTPETAPERAPEVATEIAPERAPETAPEVAREVATETAPESQLPERLQQPEQLQPPRQPGKSRRVLAAVARWTAAVLVCGGVGAGTAAWITSMERTDVPGLATESDGRWDYPKLSLPALPEGSPRPYTDGNKGEIHYADLRKLVLPAPTGATVDKKADGGWVSTDAFLALYDKDDRTALREAFADSTLRHIAARSWTMPDGTRTTVQLLQFGSVAYAEAFKDDALDAGAAADPKVVPAGVEGVVPESYASVIDVPDTTLYAFREKVPYGPEQTRWAYLQTGDTVAIVTQIRKGEALEVPFQQTVTLQNQLLG